MTVAFLIHALGERDAGHGMQRGDNLANTMAWFRLVKDATRWAICYPTMSYLAAFDDIFHGPAMLMDSLEIMLRCDVIVPTGGVMSPHMRFMCEHARRGSIAVLDLLDMGRMAPDGDEPKIEIRRRAEALGL